MQNQIFIALSGLGNVSTRLQNSANNIANVNTAGFNKNDINGSSKGSSKKMDTKHSDFLEGSNVNITEEIIGQTISKLSFRANTNVITVNDEMLGMILDIKS